jgi:ribosomal protein L7/L12
MIAVEWMISMFVAAGLFGIAIAVFAWRLSERNIANLRTRGIYPAAGAEKDEDVLRLARAGKKILAIKCYRALHKVGLKEAKDAVELHENQNA